MDEDRLAARVRATVPDAEVHVTDLTGGGDHWHCVVVSPAFEGQRPLQRQRPILDAFAPAFADGSVHALDLKCMTPGEAAQKGIPRPFVPHTRGEGEHPGSW